MDPETGEVGVVVTTRNVCVGNRVPWVRAGVGAVAAVDALRSDQNLSTPEDGGTTGGWVDRTTVDALWLALEQKGLAVETRKKLRDATHIRN